MKNNYIDLHTHSIESLDGTYAFNKLVDIAIDSGIKYLAIADHDSIKSVDKAIKYARNKDIKIIPAIELSSIIDNTPLHILGYNIDYNHPGYKQRREFVDEKLINWSKLAINKALEYGFKLIKSYKRNYTIESFNPNVIRHLKENYPEIIRGQLAYIKKVKEYLPLCYCKVHKNIYGGGLMNELV